MNQSENNVQPPVVFRDEQRQAIDLTVSSLARNRKMLWNAKMRFGKTLCALEVARLCGYRRTLILTHRPTVRTEWFESIQRLGMTGWIYGSKARSAAARATAGLSFEELEDAAKADPNLHYIYFASMQDLRGSKRVNQAKGIDKNDNVFAAKWDFLIVDEAHEGIVSRLGREVIGELQKKRTLRTLYLSGTPYNIQQMFDTTEVYHWDYTMEQSAKEEFARKHPGEENPYAPLARLNIISYNLSRDLRKYRLTEGGNDFNFGEFFRTDTATGKFAHESDVRLFLQLLAGVAKGGAAYPFAPKVLGKQLSHTLWYVPGVRAAHRLAALLTSDSQDNPFRGYAVVDVAGDGDSPERYDVVENARKEKDALMKVRQAVAANERTITLSCGRLTTGVSVPEWTGVLMLAGAAETGGARYFQTIFRAQSPYRGGNIKHDCYAIDFAPRRTLTVVDQYITNNTPQGDKTSRNDRIQQFLHFCPLTIVSGGKKTEMDTGRFITEVNSAYSDSLIRNGFRDDCLYGNLDNLRKQDLKLLDQVAEAIMRGIAAERQRNREAIAGAKNKPRRKTPKAEAEEKEREDKAVEAARVAAHRLTPRQRAIAILSQISTRFPIMIYGTVESIEGLTLNSFIENIDEESWREFMPKGVSIKLFQRLRHFYREDIFVATAKAIVERLRKADTLPVAERVAEIADILSDFCFPDRETVLTPWKVVNRQLSDTLGGYCFYDEKMERLLPEPRFVYRGETTDKVFMNQNSRVLDTSSKTGLYSLYIAYSIYKLRSSQSQGLFDMLSDDEAEALWQEIVAKNVFAVCKTRMAELITRRTLLGFHKEAKANVRTMGDLVSLVMVYKKKFIRTVADGKNFWKANNKEKMKFDAIIGNPPYQVNIGEQKDNYGIPLYNQFVEVAREMNPNYISMIMPSRWFTGGRGLDNFRRTMLSDSRLRAIFDFVDSKDCFPTVDISGGIDYFLWDSKHKAECEFTNTLHGVSNSRSRRLDQFPIFVRNNNALTFINKVMDNSEAMLSTQVSGQTPFGFVTTFRGKAGADAPGAVLVKSSGNPSYVLRDEVKKNAQWIDLYKVIFSKATCEHAGTPDRNGQFRVLSSAAILQPGAVCTQSYLVGGAYASQTEAERFLNYLNTRFVRYLMLQTITSQDLSPEKFMFVPVQDLTDESDIDWTADLNSLDQQLYAKYGITAEEAKVVENTIKPMF